MRSIRDARRDFLVPKTSKTTDEPEGLSTVPGGLGSLLLHVHQQNVADPAWGTTGKVEATPTDTPNDPPEIEADATTHKKCRHKCRCKHEHTHTEFICMHTIFVFVHECVSVHLCAFVPVSMHRSPVVVLRTVVRLSQEVVVMLHSGPSLQHNENREHCKPACTLGQPASSTPSCWWPEGSKTPTPDPHQVVANLCEAQRPRCLSRVARSLVRSQVLEASPSLWARRKHPRSSHL